MSGAVESVASSLTPAPFPARNSSLSPIRIPQPDDNIVSTFEGNKGSSEQLESAATSKGSSPINPRFPPRESSLSPAIPRPTVELWTHYTAAARDEEAHEGEHDNVIGRDDFQNEGAPVAGRSGLVLQNGVGVANGKESERELPVPDDAVSMLILTSKDIASVDESESTESYNDHNDTKEGVKYSPIKGKLPSNLRNSGGDVLKEKEADAGMGDEQRPRTSAGTPRHSPEMSTRRLQASNSFSSRLRRRSWMPSSRSPSPKKRAQLNDLPDISSSETASGVNMERKDRLSTVILSSSRAPQRPTSFSKQLTSKLRKRQSSFTALDTLTDQSLFSKPGDRSTSVIPKSRSDDKLPSATPIMAVRSSDRLSSLIQPSTFALSSKSRQARKRDELWSGFRDFDNAYGRFQSKNGEQKANIVRSSLPFLQETAFHASNFSLHLEDLDRRLLILYNWWIALLDFAKSRNFASVTSQSKSVILDAIIEIMERPEWKHFPSPFCPRLEKNATDNASESTSEGDYVAESVQHNINNWFTQCLLMQMTFVIDKMSLRSAPSLVTFCAKSCAYAFYFCPGMAGVLIRLWNLRYSTLKRVMEENGVDTSMNLRDITDKMSSTLPPTLRQLHFSTLQETHKSIRKPASYPLGTQDSQWKGPWVDRWSGQESELFYTFVKQYYLLLSHYLPNASKTERLVAAGGIFVQAQILVNLDATIRRCFPKPLDLPSLPSAQSKSPVSRIIEDHARTTSTTFDDMLSDIEATPPSVVFTGLNLNHSSFGNLTNADRNMAENRLILLLKDMLTIRNNTTLRVVRESFAHTFVDLLRAAAKATHQFNRLETDTLCTFLEETVIILVRYERTYGMTTAFLDWGFWFGVWKIMAQNNYFATETRIYSLIYSFWPAITLDADRKTELCYGFLLNKEHFESRFNHWSPMVRAYYMRLLCWRVARIHEDGGEGDLKILACLHQRLKSVHAHYLHLQQKAIENDFLHPNTVPALSAPSRRFVIIRADRPSPLLSAFDTSASNASFKRSLFLEQLCSPDFTPETGDDEVDNSRPQSAMSGASTDDDMEDSPKRWTGGGLLRSIIGPSKSNLRSKSQSPSRAGAERDAAVRPPTTSSDAHHRSGSLTAAVTSAARNDEAVTTWKRQQSTLFRPYCFRFSLEVVDRRMPTPAPMTLHIPRLPQPAQTLLMRYLRGLAIESAGSNSSSSEPSVFSDNASGRTSTSRQSDERPVEELVEESRPIGSWLPPALSPKASDTKASRELGTYCGRALAEWSVVVNECHLFFERRKAEGVPGNRYVETPLLGTAESARGPRG